MEEKKEEETDVSTISISLSLSLSQTPANVSATCLRLCLSLFPLLANNQHVSTTTTSLTVA
jgi:hypothetical protein